MGIVLQLFLAMEDGCTRCIPHHSLLVFSRPTFLFFCSFPSNGPAFLFPRLELRQSWRGNQEGRAGVYPTNAEFVRFSGGRKLLRTILARLQQGEFRFSREESLEDIPRM